MYNGVYDTENFSYMHDTLVKWLSEKINGISLGDRVFKKGISRIAIYGAGEIGRLACKDCENKIEVIAFIDKNPHKYPAIILGKSVIGLDNLDDIPGDSMILITPELYFREIMQDLTARGIDMDRICSLSMMM